MDAARWTCSTSSVVAHDTRTRGAGVKIVRQRVYRRVSGLPHGAQREIQRRLALQGVTLSEGQISRLLRQETPDPRIAPIATALKAERWRRVASVEAKRGKQSLGAVTMGSGAPLFGCCG